MTQSRVVNQPTKGTIHQQKVRYTPYARDICGGGAVRGTQIGYLWVWGREHTLDEVGAPGGAAAEVVDGLAHRLEGRRGVDLHPGGPCASASPFMGTRAASKDDAPLSSFLGSVRGVLVGAGARRGRPTTERAKGIEASGSEHGGVWMDFVLFIYRHG